MPFLSASCPCNSSSLFSGRSSPCLLSATYLEGVLPKLVEGVRAAAELVICLVEYMKLGQGAEEEGVPELIAHQIVQHMLLKVKGVGLLRANID